MENIVLNNGVEIPALGFGVFQIANHKECEQTVLQALETGYRLIDTAAAYFNGLFVVSSGFEELLDRRSQQVDDADERVIVAVSPGPAFGGLEDAVERFEASVAVA